MKFLSKNLFLIVFICFLIIPFFWFKPGEIDLGGDSSRLYFYNPLGYLRNFGLYDVVSEGTGHVEPNFYLLPFAGMLILIKSIINSPYFLITLFNSVKLGVGFLSVYLIIKEFLKSNLNNRNNHRLVEISSIIGGIFYVFFVKMLGNYNNAILSQNQVFINPLIFWLLLKYLLTESKRYLWFLLSVCFVLAPNFAYTSAPPFFAFYPLAITFLLIYIKFLLKKKIPIKGLILGFIFFLGLQSFHLIPQFLSLFDPGSYTNTRVFDQKSIINEGIGYFLVDLSLSKSSANFLIPPLLEFLKVFSVFTPLVVILGLIFRPKTNKLYLLTMIFFFVTFFLITAKITNLGVQFYLRLFFIPGFSMFRNFIGQWAFVFAFFYSLIFGQALFIINQKIKGKYVLPLTIFIILYLTFGAWQFINGEIVNPIHRESNNVKMAIKMDPIYQDTLNSISKLNEDGKILTLPFTDAFYQVLADKEGGAYVGPSTISYLAGKNDFTGYLMLDKPFNDYLLVLSKDKDYKDLNRMLGLLNIRYIFHNSSEKVYDSYFPLFPYKDIKRFLPSTQKEYASFIKNLTKNEPSILQNSSYNLFLTDDKYYLPHFYVPKEIVMYDQNQQDKLFFDSSTGEIRTAFVDNETCKQYPLCNKSDFVVPKIYFEKINPTKYKIFISNAYTPFVLVFSNDFHNNWKIYIPSKDFENEKVSVKTYFDGDIQEGKNSNIFFDSKTFETVGMKILPEERHFKVNSYANAWYIDPKDIGGSNHELIVELEGQRYFYLGIAVSTIFLVVFIVWGIRLFFRRHNI